jgi:hypothetical protein
MAGSCRRRRAGSEMPHTAFAAFAIIFITIGLILDSAHREGHGPSVARNLGYISLVVGVACLIVQILRWAGAI